MPSQNGKRPHFGQVKEARPTSRWLTPGQLAASHVIEWDEVVSHELANCIAEVTRAGAAIMFACSSDGGVFRVQILDGDARPKWYLRDAEDLNRLLRQLAQMARGDVPGGESGQ